MLFFRIIFAVLLLLIPIEVRGSPSEQPKQTISVVHTTAIQVEKAEIPLEPVPLKQSLNRAAPKPGCEQYRELVQAYFGAATDTALFVASKESGCRQDAVSSTHDYCIFQINREPATGQDINLCVRRAYEKYVGGRVGSNNWSAWYSVCTPSAVPKYSGIDCN